MTIYKLQIIKLKLKPRKAAWPISCTVPWSNYFHYFTYNIECAMKIKWTISLFGLVFCWDQRLRPNRSTLVSVRSWDQPITSAHHRWRHRRLIADFTVFLCLFLN